MKLFILTASYPPVLGGLQTAVENLAQEFVSQGHEVTVVTNRYPANLPGKSVMKGIPVYRWHFITPHIEYLLRKRADLFAAGILLAPMTVLSLWALVILKRPDVINIHFPLQQIPFVLLLKKIFKFKLIVSLHGDEIERFLEDQIFSESEIKNRGYEKKQSLVACLKVADAVTACSAHLLALASRLYPGVSSKGAVTPNGIRLERFEQKKKYQYKKPYLFAFGRMTPQKGFDILIRAFAKAAGQFPDIDLILAGEGEQLEELKQMAAECRMSDRILFYGRAAEDEVVQLLNGSEFVVIPSRRETFGIIALEAMAAGKYILASKVGGMADILKNKQAELVFPDIEAFYESMGKLMRDCDIIKQAGERNRVSVQDYSWIKSAMQYTAVFKSCIESKVER